MPSLPGLVPRPLTLAEAVAEAITLAAYKQGSTDNLAALVVDLRPDWRSSRREGPQEQQSVDNGDRAGKRDRAGPELSGTGADYSLPWHSTGLIMPQHGKRCPMLRPTFHMVTNCSQASVMPPHCLQQTGCAEEAALQACEPSGSMHVLWVICQRCCCWSQALAMCTSWRNWWHWSHAEQQLQERCRRPGLASAVCQHQVSRLLTR